MVSQAILDSVLKLSEADRLLVVSRLLETLSDADTVEDLDDEEFYAELDRRAADLENTISWGELKASLQTER